MPGEIFNPDKARAVEAEVSPETHHNLSVSQLVMKAIVRGEGQLAEGGALVIPSTGERTARSPKDKFIVYQADSSINWSSENHDTLNYPISEEVADAIHTRMRDYLDSLPETFSGDYMVGGGVDNAYATPVTVRTQDAWANLFARNLFKVPSEEAKAQIAHKEPFTIQHASWLEIPKTETGLRSSTGIIVDLDKRIASIYGTRYAGEIKKLMFYERMGELLKQRVLGMHCSANIGPEGDVSLFFGLSGTGKTTLSTVEGRKLLGDDEHGWDDNGIFNFEGGSYAKTIGLRKESEPLIYDASQHFGAVLENVAVDEQGVIDFDNGIENSRAAYPLQFIEGAELSGVAGHPSQIFFLTADVFGVIPPISKLNRRQALSFFGAGYTSKRGKTEEGLTVPESVFSPCFAEPFLPNHPAEYVQLLSEKLAEHPETEIYLVNTGEMGDGKRTPIHISRRLVEAAIHGEITDENTVPDALGFMRPLSIEGVNSALLDPRNSFENPNDYDTRSETFSSDYDAFMHKVYDGILPEDVLAASPKPQKVA